ncbi:MAG: CoA transferase [Chloroflexota bacterium]|nr:MAG: CoA transferase [Chloroflexota bacterium]
MKPLNGIQLLSLANNIPGPAAVAQLRDLGAKVVKIEPPAGDLLAIAAPAWYGALHLGIEVERLNLKSAEGRADLEPHLATSHLLVTSSRPASLARMGLDWPTLAGRYPNLCQVAIVGYPGAEAARPGHDLTYQAELGLLDPPGLPRTVLADLAGAERAVSAALGLLLAMARSGGRDTAGDVMEAADRYVEVALSGATAAFAEPLSHGLTAPGGFLGGQLPGYNLYRAQDGWIAVAALEAHFLRRLAAELGLIEVTIEALADVFGERPAEFWQTWAAERDLPIVALAEGITINNQ